MTVHIAMVGLGYWGPNLARNLGATIGARLHTLCDARRDLLEKFASQYPSAATTNEYTQVLANPDVHAVVLATPVQTHFELASAALRAGKHVLVEKPLAQTVKQGAALVSLAREHRRILMCGHVFLYSPPVRMVKQLIDGGTLGKVLHVYSQRLNLGVIRQDVNTLWNVAPHDISILNYWLGAVPLAVQATAFSYIQPGVEDVAFATLEYPDRVSAHVHASWLDPHKVRRMTLIGERKMVVYDDVAADAKVVVHDKSAKRQTDGGSAPRVVLTNGDVSIVAVDPTEPLRLECQHFVDCIAKGEQPLSDGPEALRVLETLEALQESLAAGGVRVPVVHHNE